MENMDGEIKGVCCFDCAVIDSSGDVSSITDNWDFTRKQMLFISQVNYEIVVGDKVEEFSDKCCDICLTKLAGQRYDVSMWEIQN